MNGKTLLAEAIEMKDEIVENRRAIHRAPEVGAHLPQTVQFVEEKLRLLGYEPRELGGGVVAELTGEDTGRCILLRADMDALRVQEKTDLPFRSENGSMHACGHDMHAAMLLGAARLLKAHQSELKGTVKLVFQPAEEGVRGAAAIAASGVLDDVDWFTAGHIGCDAKPGQVGVSHEGYLATTKFDLEIFGLPCAAGSPEKGHSALMCACNTVMALGSLPGHSKGITRVQVGKIVSGTARNIVAGHAYVVLEVRGESTEINDYMAANVETTVKGLAAAYECTYKLTRMGEAVTYKGDEEAVELVKAAARDAEGVTLVTDMNAKVGSEDCTMLIRRIQAHGGKCAFFYFGCDHHGHHRPDFEIQDRTSLPVGWGVFTGFVARTNAR